MQKILFKILIGKNSWIKFDKIYFFNSVGINLIDLVSRNKKISPLT
jgi:hypothetical protein